MQRSIARALLTHRDAERLQGVQDAEPHGDRFERPVADGANDGEIGQIAKSGDDEALGAARLDLAGGEP